MAEMMLEPGTRVMFTTSHYKWRCKANAWPSREEWIAWYKRPRHSPKGITPASVLLRETIKGTVMASSAGWAKVLWDDGRGTTCHFADNLEITK